jgi:hypothetical protein
LKLEASKIEIFICFYFKMQFQKVTVLVHGKKYKICQLFSKYTGTYSYSIYNIHSFVNINGKFQNFYYDAIFYEPIFQKDKIQSDMEQRALTLILKKITGDETFSW